MAQSVIGSITLGYRPLWNRARELAAVQLYVEAAQGGAIDAVHLVDALQELSTMATPQLLLSMHNRRLLSDMLAHAPAGDYWVEVRGDWLLQEADIAERVPLAHARGLQLVWRGSVDDWAAAPLKQCFSRRLLSLSPAAAARALARAPAGGGAPFEEGQIYEGLEHATLASLCLDQAGAWAVAGWPSDDVLRARQPSPVGPDAEVVRRAARAVAADQSIEQIEAIVREEPVLAFRFLSFTRSAARDQHAGIESVRQGVMMLGYAALARWLDQQLQEAEADLDLRPVKAGMVLRARLTEHLLHAGDEDSLRREIYLCGLFAGLDRLLSEPSSTLLARLPLSDRLHEAIVQNGGPYAPPLQMARALEGEDTKDIRAVCRRHGMDMAEVNRQLLRTLVTARR